MSALDAARGKKILVVDDEKFSRNIIMRVVKDILRDSDPVPAADASEALNTLIADWKTYALVICDFNMPILTGLHFLKMVRSGFEGIRYDLPVIMLTGHADSALVQAALALDVDGFVVKPVSKAALQARLERALGSGDSGLKPPAFYGKIDIETISRQVLAGVAVAMPEAAAAPSEPGRMVSLDAIPLPATLAVPIVAPTGELLLNAGMALSPRLIDRLRELRAMGIVPDMIRIE